MYSGQRHCLAACHRDRGEQQRNSNRDKTMHPGLADMLGATLSASATAWLHFTGTGVNSNRDKTVHQRLSDMLRALDIGTTTALLQGVPRGVKKRCATRR